MSEPARACNRSSAWPGRRRGVTVAEFELAVMSVGVEQIGKGALAGGNRGSLAFKLAGKAGESSPRRNANEPDNGPRCEQAVRKSATGRGVHFTSPALYSVAFMVALASRVQAVWLPGQDKREVFLNGWPVVMSAGSLDQARAELPLTANGSTFKSGTPVVCGTRPAA